MSDENDKVEHYPAPWRVCFDHPSADCRDRIGYIRIGHSRWNHEISMSCCCGPGTQQRASLYVTAAAPEMLAALEAVLEGDKPENNNPAYWVPLQRDIRAIIAKARNEVTT